jgi:type VI protein secretion system component VasK
MTTPPDPLDRQLDRWANPPEPSSRLTSEVWRRIALDEEPRSARRGWWASIDAWFARPPFAMMFVASCALLGLFLAEVRVNHQQRERNTQLARSYLQLIDPLLKSNLVADRR